MKSSAVEQVFTSSHITTAAAIQMRHEKEDGGEHEEAHGRNIKTGKK